MASRMWSPQLSTAKGSAASPEARAVHGSRSLSGQNRNKKEEGRNRSGWEARKVCSLSHSWKLCWEAVAKVAEKMLSC